MLFGNGLGMSLDPNVFSLGDALRRVWDNPTILTDEQRAMVFRCLPGGTEDGRPSSEADLGQLQRVLAACDVLNSVPLAKGENWLSSQGEQFPAVIRAFVHAVACEFFKDRPDGNRFEIPAEFSQNLTDFVNLTKSHVTTLNYDYLLGRLIYERMMVNDSEGVLLDGFRRRLFNRRNLFREKSEHKGWFLHLHGSPLFYDHPNDGIRLLEEKRLRGADPISSAHLVLTHVEQKTSVIASSEILSVYWEFFERALDESEQVILFGYSGGDDHINDLLSSTNSDLRVKIVEWLGSGDKKSREEFWSRAIRKKIELVQQESIFDFDEW